MSENRCYVFRNSNGDHMKNKYYNRIPNKIVRRCIESTCKNITMTILSKRVGMPNPSMWAKLSDVTRWDAEGWLATLWALGFVKYRNGQIIITNVALANSEIARLDKMAEKQDFYVDP